MRRSLWPLVLVLLAAALALGALGFVLPLGHLQALSGNVGSTLLGLAAAILLVNHYLASSEKGAAAAPLVKLIAPAINELHNDLFVTHLTNTFGIAKLRTLVDTYQRNKRDPRAFSPGQCNELHAAIMSKSSELIRVYDVLIDQFRELSMITGWTFDPSVTAAALEARLNFLKFKSIQQATDQDSKYEILGAYLDGEASASAVFNKLLNRLGHTREEQNG